MSVHHGKDGIVKVGNNVVASVTAWSFSEKVALVSAETMGDSDEVHLQGLKSATGKIDCLLDPDEQATDVVLGDPIGDTILGDPGAGVMLGEPPGQERLTTGTLVALHLYPQGADSGFSYWQLLATVETLDGQAGMSEVGKRAFGFKAAEGASWLTV